MRTVHLTKGLLALVLVTGVVAAGCGGGDDDDGGDPVTKDEWIAQVGKICRDGDREVEAEGEKAFEAAQESGEPDSEAERRFIEETVVPNIEQQVADIAALPRPERDEEEIEAIVAAADEGVETINADPGALEEDPDPFARATRLIREYGVTDCG